MHETDLHLEPNEASDLCRVLEGRAAEHGWDRALLTVLDEAAAEDALALLTHNAGTAIEHGWEAHRVSAEPTTAGGKTQDAEACASRDGVVYVLGSQFGSKDGPLQASRSWIARLTDDDLVAALTGGRARLQIARLRFGLHRAVNDALAAAAVDLWPSGEATRRAYVDATIARGAEKGKRWAGRVAADDQPINVEALELRADGRGLLGLRYPVSADGHPLLVEVADLDALFDDPDAVPECGPVWVLEGVGSREAPAGLRGLDSRGDDRFDAIVGDLDASGKGATILADHAAGARAESAHVRFALPLAARGGAVRAERVHGFGDVRRVEGVAVDDEGHAHYVIDEEGRVGLRTLVAE
ncbi:MAG TPA: hypothetical protein VIL49_18935 [Capillimicrobium sp.]